MTNSYSKSLWALIGVLLIRCCYLFIVMAFSGIGLGPDEAQYWTWSQDLSIGYYSKPPAIAWQIWTTTALFGNNEFGVRLSAMIIGFLLPIAVFLLARFSGLKPMTSFWAGVLMALTPLGLLGSFFATTDGGYILFWTLACAGIAKALKERTSFPYLWMGLSTLAGALYKWPIYILWPFAIVFFFIYGNRQDLWKRVLAGIFISLLALIPSIWWNWSHDWATFRHVFTTIKGGNEPNSQANFLGFIGSQVALVSPVIFGLLICSYVWMIARWRELSDSLKFCGSLSFIIWLGYLVLSCFEKIQGNWALQAYPTGMVLIAALFCEQIRWGRVALIIGAITSLLLLTFILAIPRMQEHSIFKSFKIPYKASPFKHNIGWNALGETLKNNGYNPKENFLFADKYQMSSILSFYTESQKRAYFMNLNQIRRNQFSYWPSMAIEQKGKTGYFVATENAPHLASLTNEQVEKYKKELSKYFIKVDYLGFFPIFDAYGEVSKGAIVFKGIDYNGDMPSEPSLY